LPLCYRYFLERSYIKTLWSKFPGHPVVRILSFTALSLNSIPGQGTKTPQTHSATTTKKMEIGKVGSRTMLSSRTFCNDKKKCPL